MSNWEADLLALTYEDVMTVKRNIEATDEETGISSFIENVVVLEDIPCSLSRKDEAVISGDVPNITATHKIFTRPENEIIAGDMVEVVRFGKLYTFIASKPFYYISHVEIPVTEKERI